MTDESTPADDGRDSTDSTDSTAPLFDPESLRDRPDVEFVERTERLDPEAFAEVRASFDDFDSHVAVGVTNDDGEVLLADDGEHGWTLAAFPVESGEDWVAVAREGAAALTGAPVEIDRPERVRRIDYCPADGNECLPALYNVVLRASPVSGRPVAADPDGRGGRFDEVRWFGDLPDGVDPDAAPAEDVRLFLD